MDLLAEIQNRKRKLEEIGAVKDKKYVKKGDLEKERVKQYYEEQRKLEEKKNKKKEETKPAIEAPAPEEPKEEKVIQVTLPRKEVKRRLRVRNEPITLFGETDELRFERLRLLELKHPMEYTEGSGERPDFLKSLREQEEIEDDPELLQKQKKDLAEEDMYFKDDGTEPKTREETIWFFFRQMLAEWEVELDKRPEQEKRVAQGKIDTATYRQTRSYIKPLFVSCKRKNLPTEIAKELLNIVNCAKDRNYMKANDHYLRLAIGNAPWPMGVTAVGIHERSAREKIHSNQVAHVLNDETQRKYIQAVKRLLTFCQKKYPTQASKMMG
jgi:pre-mRNA-splicing factor 18